MALVMGEGRAYRLQVLEHSPVKLFSDLRVARAVGVGEGVALRGRRAPDTGQIRFVKPQSVADFVQARCTRQVSVDQGEDVAERRELPDVGSRLPCQPVDKSLGNPGVFWKILWDGSEFSNFSTLGFKPDLEIFLASR